MLLECSVPHRLVSFSLSSFCKAFLWCDVAFASVFCWTNDNVGSRANPLKKAVVSRRSLVVVGAVPEKTSLPACCWIDCSNKENSYYHIQLFSFLLFLRLRHDNGRDGSPAQSQHGDHHATPNIGRHAVVLGLRFAAPVAKGLVRAPSRHKIILTVTITRSVSCGWSKKNTSIHRQAGSGDWWDLLS